MTATDTIRAYYAALDGHAYDDLEGLLAPEFAHERPDRTIEGRERFVEFMREGRPQTDTTHEIRSIVADGERVVAEGQLLVGDGEARFRFADVHQLEGGRIVHLRTYTA